mmetsp:Transcript_36669/g.117758  ORF Transcript_36669/g.117758 Transcript_36669/m.117758 type:complete len:248 (-) Transcript_36669:30-773(-)
MWVRIKKSTPVCRTPRWWCAPPEHLKHVLYSTSRSSDSQAFSWDLGCCHHVSSSVTRHSSAPPPRGANLRAVLTEVLTLCSCASRPGISVCDVGRPGRGHAVPARRVKSEPADARRDPHNLGILLGQPRGHHAHPPLRVPVCQPQRHPHDLGALLAQAGPVNLDLVVLPAFHAVFMEPVVRRWAALLQWVQLTIRVCTRGRGGAAEEGVHRPPRSAPLLHRTLLSTLLLLAHVGRGPTPAAGTRASR